MTEKALKVARYYDREDIRIEDIELQERKPGTDLHEFKEGPILIPPHGHPYPISGEDAPVTLIHDDVDTSEDNRFYHLSQSKTFLASVGYHAVERAGYASEETARGKLALVDGAGPIGLLTAAVLKAFGATVVVSELSSLRRQKALE